MVAGVVVPFWLGRPPLEAIEVADKAEAHGYMELWVGEMLHFDAFALAGAIATRTTAITITVGPLAISLRDPVALAMGVASVSVLGGRPARLALGASSKAVVEKWHGRVWGGEEEQIEEVIELIKEVLAGGRTDHKRSRGFRSPLAPVPAHVSLAASGPRMMAAARFADRTVLNLVPVEEIPRAVAVGKPVAVWVVAGVDPTPAGVEQVRRQLAMYLAAPGYRRVMAAAGLDEAVAAANAGASTGELAAMIGSDALEVLTALGDNRQVRHRIETYERAGAEVMVVPVTEGDPGGARTLTSLAD